MNPRSWHSCGCNLTLNIHPHIIADQAHLLMVTTFLDSVDSVPMPHCKKCWGMASWTWQKTQGINLGSTWPGSQYNPASVDPGIFELIVIGLWSGSNSSSNFLLTELYLCSAVLHYDSLTILMHFWMKSVQLTLESWWFGSQNTYAN